MPTEQGHFQSLSDFTLPLFSWYFCTAPVPQTKTLPEQYVYYASLLPLLLFYVAFATVLYPMAPVLHPYHLLETWKAMLPAGARADGAAFSIL